MLNNVVLTDLMLPLCLRYCAHSPLALREQRHIETNSKGNNQRF